MDTVNAMIDRLTEQEARARAALRYPDFETEQYLDSVAQEIAKLPVAAWLPVLRYLIARLEDEVCAPDRFGVFDVFLKERSRYE